MKECSSIQTKERAEFILEQVNAWINNVDGKVSDALAFSGVLIGFILIQGTPQAFSDFAVAKCIGVCTFLKVALVVILYVASLLAICFFLNAILCRVTVQENSDSHLFFGTIQSSTYQEYSIEFKKLTEDAYIAELLEQIHTNSKICKKKMKRYNCGMWMLFTAVILCFVCFVFQLV